MPASMGVNLRVTGHCRQGGRKYMEDFFSVAYQQTEDERDLEYAFFGIYDGHGGAEAAAFAKERLMEAIVRHKYFWSDNDEDVLRAIKLGYIATHYAMWKEQDKWPKTASGLPSTAGTTASIAFIRRGKIYIGHVGDSAIVLGYQEPGCSMWKAKSLTRDHKPESAVEMSRIKQCGGKVVAKSGVPRVVWNRPRIGHKGPVRRSTPIDEIPFLAVARSLGDLWSYNSEMDEFVVSPDPDCSVIPIDTASFRCLIFGTDGLYNMLSPQMAVHIVQQAEKHNEEAMLSDSPNKIWLNPSKCLVERALKLWSTTKMRADNTSVVTLMLDPPGPPRAQVLRNRKKSYPDSGLQILTRYQNEEQQQQQQQRNKDNNAPTTERSPTTIPEHNPHILKSITSYRTPSPPPLLKDDFAPPENNSKNFVLKPRESLSFDPRKDASNSGEIEAMRREPCSNCKKKKNNNSAEEVPSSSSVLLVDAVSSSDSSNPSKTEEEEENIQINEISSSSSEIEEEDGDFNKSINRRGGKGRVVDVDKNAAMKSVKKQDRKRRASAPYEGRDFKRMKHNLRVRKTITNETEMVNQVDSTNKDLNNRDKKDNKIVDVDSVVRTRKSRLLEPEINLRTSQRLRTKPKLDVRILNKLSKSDLAKNLLLLPKNSDENNKSDGTMKAAESAPKLGKSPRNLLVTSGKSKTDRLKKQRRTFKVGYLRKLRRNVSSRIQSK